MNQNACIRAVKEDFLLSHGMQFLFDLTRPLPS